MHYLAVADICTHEITQLHTPRKRHIQDLVENLNQGGSPEPVDVFFDGFHYWLGDGYCRYEAHLITDVKYIAVKIFDGTQRDAVLHWIRQNAAHNTLNLSCAERLLAAEVLLCDPEWQQWSDNAIAQICNIDSKAIKNLRIDLRINPPSPRKRTNSHPIKTTVTRGNKKANSAQAKPTKVVDAASLVNQINKQLESKIIDIKAEVVEDDFLYSFPNCTNLATIVRTRPLEQHNWTEGKSTSVFLQQKTTHEINADDICFAVSNNVHRLATNHIKSIWSVIAPLIPFSSKLLALYKWSEAELERLITDTRRELDIRYHAEYLNIKVARKVS